MAAALYLDVPDYAALLLRESFSDLSQPDALIPRSKNWWYGRASWNEQAHRWTFPSGATVTFGYLDNDNAVYQYQSAAYQFIGVDELTQHTEFRYTYLASRLRRPETGPLSRVPLRQRAATNPGGKGHDFVKRRFIPTEFFKIDTEVQFARPWYKDGRFFIPARLEDNPSLDRRAYEVGMARLDPLTRARLRHGDWRVHSEGRFRREWLTNSRYRIDLDRLVRSDGASHRLAEVPKVVILDPANRKTKSSKYTAISVFGDLGNDRVAVLDVVRKQLTIEQIVPELNAICARWGPIDWAGIEANGFQLALVNEARQAKHRHIPTVYELDPEGKSKLTRATPAILRAEQGRIYLPEEADWLDEWEGEVFQFTGDEKQDAYTDQVDCLAYFVLHADRVGGEPAMPFALGERRR